MARKRRSVISPEWEKRGKAVLVGLLGLLLLVIAFDGARVFASKTGVESEASEAAAAAASAVKGEQATPLVAQEAFNAAKERMDRRGFDFQIDEQSFTLMDDGKVKMTVTKTVPLFLLNKYPPMAKIGETTVTVTEGPLTLG